MSNEETIRILLADDDKEDRDDFIEAFDGLKIKTIIETVKDGIELINYFQSPSAVIPDLLFLDLNMPKKSGLECLIEIKQIENLKNLTVVIYSTSSYDKDIEDTFLNGANIYLKKASDLLMLKKSLLHILTLNWQYHTTGMNRDNYLLQL
jgi:CheY-like chemotaxis protein